MGRKKGVKLEPETVAKIAAANRGKKKPSLSAAQKELLSIAQKKAHAEGRHPGWAHKNQDPERRSYPERWFLKVISNDDVLSKMQIVEQFSVWKYFLDFAFVEYKVDLEIDGCQHKRPDVIEKDLVRDKYLTANGWKVYRIDWSKMYENTLEEIEAFKTFMQSIPKSI